jgi:1-acyl-sn-glycerol-3-phosphate acyltransferase
MSDEPLFLDLSSVSLQEMKTMANGSDKDRSSKLRPLKGVTQEEAVAQASLTFWEHLCCVLFLAFGPPNGVFNIPLVLCFVGYFIVGNITQTFLNAVIFILIPLAIIPQPYIRNSTEWWMSWLVVKYFSFKVITECEYDPKCRHIYVAPPHGVFPYGNLLAVQAWRARFGFPFRGLASSAALRVPVFKQVLRCVGVVDASRHVAHKALVEDGAIGISTGGVAEVFETNHGDECILLKERIGLIKLAIRTGAELVPCYLFGNTKLLDCWSGEHLPHQIKLSIEWLSRKAGFAIIVMYGRWGLAIPYRLPVLAVSGRGIPTKHIQCDEPTMEQILLLQGQLLTEMERIFDTYKHLYGWEDKKLVIK